MMSPVLPPEAEASAALVLLEQFVVILAVALQVTVALEAVALVEAVVLVLAVLLSSARRSAFP